VNPWITVTIIGVGTYLTRLSFVGVLGRRAMPQWAERPLRFVAPAVLAALVAPAVLLREGSFEVVPSVNPRLYGAAVAALVAWRFKNLAAAILAGMGSLWLLQWLV
jgi:branched-subunit amino acid transport protein